MAIPAIATRSGLGQRTYYDSHATQRTLASGLRGATWEHLNKIRGNHIPHFIDWFKKMFRTRTFIYGVLFGLGIGGLLLIGTHRHCDCGDMFK